MPARGCGTIRTERNRTSSTTAATASRTIRPADTRRSYSSALLEDQRRCSLDLGDLDVRPRLDHLAVEERSRRPDLAADLHAPAVDVHALEDDGASADERRRASAGRRRQGEMTARDRPQNAEREQRPADEYDELPDDSEPGRGDDRRTERRRHHGSEHEETRRGDLADGEERRDDDPDAPRGHGGDPRCVAGGSRP